MVPPPPPGGPPPSPFSSGFGHTPYQNQQNAPPYYNQGPLPLSSSSSSPPPSRPQPSSSSSYLIPPDTSSHARPLSEQVSINIPGQFSPPPGIPIQGLGPRSSTPNISNISQPIPSVPEKKYHELPAGLMVPVVLV